MARYTRLGDDEIQQIAESYGLNVVSSDPIMGGAGNSSYLLHTRQGRIVLTVFDEKSAPQVLKLGRLLIWLAQYEFRTSLPLSSAHGGMITVYQDKPVMLKGYIEGDVRRELSETMLVQVGTAMAGLHQFPIPDFLPKEHAYGRQDFSSVIGRNIDPAYELWLAKRLAYLERRMPQKLPTGLIHGDLFYDNVLFLDERFKAIIDFEEACCYYKEFDLGMGILGLCAEGDTVALNKAQALVTGYQRVRKLETREKESLQLFVEYAAIATSYWRFWKYHVQATMPDKAGKHRQMVRLAEGVRAIPKTRFRSMVLN